MQFLDVGCSFFEDGIIDLWSGMKYSGNGRQPIPALASVSAKSFWGLVTSTTSQFSKVFRTSNYIQLYSRPFYVVTPAVNPSRHVKLFPVRLSATDSELLLHWRGRSITIYLFFIEVWSMFLIMKLLKFWSVMNKRIFFK